MPSLSKINRREPFFACILFLETKTLSTQFSANEIIGEYGSTVKEESNSWLLLIKKNPDGQNFNDGPKYWPNFDAVLQYKPKEDGNGSSIIANVKLSMYSSLKRGHYKNLILTKEVGFFKKICSPFRKPFSLILIVYKNGFAICWTRIKLEKTNKKS